jgi:hypothetical protein
MNKYSIIYVLLFIFLSINIVMSQNEGKKTNPNNPVPPHGSSPHSNTNSGPKKYPQHWGEPPLMQVSGLICVDSGLIGVDRR